MALSAKHLLIVCGEEKEREKSERKIEKDGGQGRRRERRGELRQTDKKKGPGLNERVIDEQRGRGIAWARSRGVREGLGAGEIAPET